MIQRLVIVHELGHGLQVDQRGQLINLLNEGEDSEVLVLEHGPPALVGLLLLNVDAMVMDRPGRAHQLRSGIETCIRTLQAGCLQSQKEWRAVFLLR